MDAPHPLPHLSAVSQRRRILAARGMRAFADGMVSIVLPIHLLAIGCTPLQVGVLATATLAGSGVLTMLVGMQAGQIPRRTLLMIASGLMVATGIGFATCTQFGWLLVVAVIGTLNPGGGDVSVFLPVEHATLADLTPDEHRTATFARYSLVGALCGATGALAAGLPDAVMQYSTMPLSRATGLVFALYAAVGIACAWIYRGVVPPEKPTRDASDGALGPSRRRVLALAALFSVDAFAGGFLVQSLLALWLFQRFGLSAGEAGALFFGTGLLSAASYMVAARIARRFGLLRTMVFTHLPSSLLLLGAALSADVSWAIACLLARSALSQMDVPTRSSFVMAVVTPGERPAAASITAVPRSLAAAASPALAGSLLAASSFAWPLVIAAGLKIGYDIVLLLAFRRVRPPEEEGGRDRAVEPVSATRA